MVTSKGVKHILLAHKYLNNEHALVYDYVYKYGLSMGSKCRSLGGCLGCFGLQIDINNFFFC